MTSALLRRFLIAALFALFFSSDQLRSVLSFTLCARVLPSSSSPTFTPLLLTQTSAATVLSRPSASSDGRDLVIKSEHYHYYCTGACAHPVNTTTSGGFVLMGGGTDVDAAFLWQIHKCNHGDFLVLRTDLDSLYDPYVYALGGGLVNSAATLVILDRQGAFEPFVAEVIAGAEALFFAGGDQYTYYHNWRDSPVSEAIMARSRVPISIGGTSAGLASLPQFVYDAQFDTVTSGAALKNPYAHRVTLVSDFFAFPLLRDIITDTHFVQRDRMGRLVTFCARLLADHNTTHIAGIGVDQETALLFELNGTASIVSWQKTGSAYVVQPTSAPSVCQPNMPLTVFDINVMRFSGNTTDIGNVLEWTWPKAFSYSLNASAGKLNSSTGHIY